MKLRRTVFLAMIAVATFGLAAKLYPRPGRWWINNWGPASVAYVVFFMLAAFLIVPRRELATRIAMVVLLTTCALEFLQLWHPPWLQAMRSTFLGVSLLGTSFSWWDFPAYVVGAGRRGMDGASLVSSE